MYYEETIINGTLHYRDDPEGDWKPVSEDKIVLLTESSSTITGGTVSGSRYPYN